MNPFFLFFLGTTLFVKAQFPNVLISALNDPEEVSIAINPKNPFQIVAGANLNNVYRSADGGYTWISDTISCHSYGVWGDPVLFWDTANVCYYIHLSSPNPTITPGGSWIDRIVMQSSNNFGASYSTCHAVGKNGTKAQDKAWAVVNPTNNEIHITWTQFDVYGVQAPGDSTVILHSKTSNGGITWTSPQRISFYAGDCIDGDNTVEGAVPAIGPNGEVYVSWAGPKGLVFQKSLNGGITWMPVEKIIGAIPGGWDYPISGIHRCNGLPFTFCDLSNSPYKGTIYINWSDQRAGANDGDIFIIKSTDGGNTWTQPLRVNNDVPGKQQFMSAMTIDQVTGYVYVIYYDRRNFSAGTATDVYMAVSKDGGATFTNYKVNSQSFNTYNSVFIGDYIGISAHNNIIRPIWTQSDITQLSYLKVYTAIIDPVTLGIYESRPETIDISTVKPNPFKTETEVNFSLHQKNNLSIQLIDNAGKIIHQYCDQKEYSKGKHNLIINANQLSLAKGVYFLVFYGTEKSKFIKLIKE